MNKDQLAKKLADAFGDESVKIITPNKFLSFVQTVLSEQYEKLVGMVEKKQLTDQEDKKVLMDDLTKEFQENNKLLQELKKTVSDSKVTGVEVTNFPEFPKPAEPIKIPPFPTEMDFKMPKWLEKSVMVKIKLYIQEGLKQLVLDKPLDYMPFRLSQDGVVVKGKSGKSIYVYAIKLNAVDDTETYWVDGGGVDIEGRQSYVQMGGYTESVSAPTYLFKISEGQDLELVVKGLAAGRVSYWIE